jgi:hypothetical protein
MQAGPGRPKNSPNKVTNQMKHEFLTVYDALQNEDNPNIGKEIYPKHLYKWAKANPNQFYNIVSKLIPANYETKTDLNVSGEVDIKYILTNADKVAREARLIQQDTKLIENKDIILLTNTTNIIDSNCTEETKLQDTPLTKEIQYKEDNNE